MIPAAARGIAVFLVLTGCAVAFPPRGGGGSQVRIAFAVHTTPADSVWTMNADGSAPAQLVSCGAGECYPSWSPDGTRMMFQQQTNGSAVYVVNLDGTDLLRLSPTPGFDTRPSWSPDGTRIVFCLVTNPGPPLQSDILTMNADGSNRQTILTNGSYNLEPRYSPDGTRIAFMSGVSGTQQIHVMNANGSGVTQLTSVGVSGDPFWSPNGARISFSSGRGGNVNVWTMNADGSSQAQLTFWVTPDEGGDASWSSDGTRIAYEHDVGGNGQSDPNVPADVQVINADGAGGHTTGQACASVGCAPRWAPR